MTSKDGFWETFNALDKHYKKTKWVSCPCCGMAFKSLGIASHRARCCEKGDKKWDSKIK